MRSASVDFLAFKRWRINIKKISLMELVPRSESDTVNTLRVWVIGCRQPLELYDEEIGEFLFELDHYEPYRRSEGAMLG